MNAPLKAVAGPGSIEAELEATMREHRPRGARGGARAGARPAGAEEPGARRHGQGDAPLAQRDPRRQCRGQAEAKSGGATPAFLDRLSLDAERIEAMAAGLDVIRKLKDPVGTVMGSWRRPNGMRIERVRVPLGVIGVIYESRPNVTADAGALCLKAGNAAILRGGSESFRSCRAIHAALVEGLRRSRAARRGDRAGADARPRSRRHDARAASTARST